MKTYIKLEMNNEGTVEDLLPLMLLGWESTKIIQFVSGTNSEFGHSILIVVGSYEQIAPLKDQAIIQRNIEVEAYEHQHSEEEK